MLHNTLTKSNGPTYQIQDDLTIRRPNIGFRPYYDLSLQPDPTIDALTKSLLPIYLAGFLHQQHPNGIEPNNPLFSDLYNHLRQAQRLLVFDVANSPEAFVVSRLIKCQVGTVYHLQGIVINPAFQGHELGLHLLQNELRLANADYLAFHTQSRRMHNLGHKLADLNESDALQLAALIGTNRQAGLIDRGRYGRGSLYGDINRFRPEAIKGIGFEQGDAIICAGPIKKEALQNEPL